jgi:hypothetical protein
VRVIRPRTLDPEARRRAVLLALSMLCVGVVALELASVARSASVALGILATVAALALGVGTAWLWRVLRPNRTSAISGQLVDLLAPTFDDSYTLVVAPRLPVRDAARLDGVLIGPAGVRVLTARDWEGRYRVRGRVWEFDARGRRGWIRCRTNPSFEAVALADGFVRWTVEQGHGDLAVRPAVAFPGRGSKIVLQEPTDEVVTADNAPWWANTIGRVRRLDPGAGARLVQSILEAAERDPRRVAARASDPA